MDSKKPWQSKTILLNALVALLGVLVVFVPQAKVVLDWVNSNGVILGVVWSMANVVLRWISKDKIVLSD